MYPPNKVILYHDGIGQAVAELEFKYVLVHKCFRHLPHGHPVLIQFCSERVRGLKARKGALFVALARRVVGFQFGVESSESSSESMTAIGKGKGKEKAADSTAGSGTGFTLQKLGEWETALNENGKSHLTYTLGSR